MKTNLYVYSGTGNSLSIALKLQSIMEGATIISIPNCIKNFQNNEIPINADKIGIIFPNYFGNIPNVVKQFIQNANFKNVKYIFSIVTAGGGQGYSINSLKKELERKNANLNYAKCLSGVSNYVVAWYFRAKQPVEYENIMKTNDMKLDDINRDISNEVNSIEPKQAFYYYISRFISDKEVMKDTRPWDKEFSADSNCIGCGKCQKICQFENIKINQGKPEFLHNCQRCMACLTYCPQKAIRFKGKVLSQLNNHKTGVPYETMLNFVNLQFEN